MVDNSISKTSGQHNDTSDLFGKAIDSIIEGATGIAGSKKHELLLSIGHLVQRTRAIGFLGATKATWEDLREKGKIDPGYETSSQHKDCLQEFLDFIDNDMPDEIRFEAMQNVFLNAAVEEKSTRNSILPQQFLKICRGLSSGEVLLLRSIYQYSNEGNKLPDHMPASRWIQLIAENSELKYESLVESLEECLMAKHLLSRRRHGDRSGIEQTDHFRLTKLGYDLCEFICDFPKSDGDAQE